MENENKQVSITISKDIYTILKNIQNRIGTKSVNDTLEILILKYDTELK